MGHKRALSIIFKIDYVHRGTKNLNLTFSYAFSIHYINSITPQREMLPFLLTFSFYNFLFVLFHFWKQFRGFALRTTREMCGPYINFHAAQNGEALS